MPAIEVRRCGWHPCGMRSFTHILSGGIARSSLDHRLLGWQPFGLMPSPGTTFNHTRIERGTQRIRVKIDILANLRRAVEDAGLPSHEQRLDAILLESRKDLSD